MKKLITFAAVALVATPAFAFDIELALGSKIKLEPSDYGQGSAEVVSKPGFTYDIGIGKDGSFYWGDWNTGIQFEKSYNVGHDHGYNKGFKGGYEDGHADGVASVKSEADLLAWIKEQTGMKPSKLIEAYNAQLTTVSDLNAEISDLEDTVSDLKAEVSDLESDLEEAQTDAQAWQDKAGCALLEIQGVDDVDEVKDIVYDCVVTKNPGNPLS